MKNRSGPDFIGIGAQKAATTWLDITLRLHPDIWMPPIKELHILDEYALSKASPAIRKCAQPWVRARWLRNAEAAFRSFFFANYNVPIGWAPRLLFSERSIQTYHKYFPATNEHVRGEITPAYQDLSEPIIRELHDRLPELKLVYILRNPIDRAWSHARMELLRRQRRHADTLTTKDYIEFLSSQSVLSRGYYADIIERWTNIYPSKQFGIWLFDSVESNPSQTIIEIVEFLNLDATPMKQVHLSPAIHKGIPQHIPEEVCSYLTNQYRNQIVALERRYNLPVRHWLEA